MGSSPASGSVLTARSLEPVSDSVSPSLSLSFLARVLSLSLSKINVKERKKGRKEERKKERKKQRKKEEERKREKERNMSVVGGCEEEINTGTFLPLTVMADGLAGRTKNKMGGDTSYYLCSTS